MLPRLSYIRFTTPIGTRGEPTVVATMVATTIVMVISNVVLAKLKSETPDRSACFVCHQIWIGIQRNWRNELIEFRGFQKLRMRRCNLCRGCLRVRAKRH